MKQLLTEKPDRREFVRRQCEVVFEVRVGAYREELVARNRNDAGLFLETKNHPPLPVRTIVCLTESGKETILGRVVWVSEDGMGVELLDRPANCCKPKATPTDS